MSARDRAWNDLHGCLPESLLNAHLDNVQAEARAQALAEVRAAVEGLDGSPDYCISHVEGLCGFRAAVLAALDGLEA